MILDLVLALMPLQSSFHSLFMYEIRRNEEAAVQDQTLCIATNKDYLTSFKKTTNPNVSPIGKRFGFECFEL